MSDDRDNIIDKFKDIDHSKEIEKSKKHHIIKAKDNKHYDNYGYHWYPKQTPSTKGTLFGLSMFGLGILILITQLIIFDVFGIVISILLIIGGRFLAGHFAVNMEKEKQSQKMI